MSYSLENAGGAAPLLPSSSDNVRLKIVTELSVTATYVSCIRNVIQGPVSDHHVNRVRPNLLPYALATEPIGKMGDEVHPLK
jgi:hypothetical protein